MANYKAGDLEKWARKINANIDDIITATCLDISTKIIQRTPVDTGRLRGNWQATIGAVATSSSLSRDKTGQSTIAKAATVSEQAPGNIFFLVNNLPYARVAEFGEWGTGPGATDRTTRDGFSIQAPYGMVRVTASEFIASLRQQIAARK